MRSSKEVSALALLQVVAHSCYVKFCANLQLHQAVCGALCLGAHTCQAGADAHRSSDRKCIFTGDGPYEWCVTMQDGGGWNIKSLLQYGGFSE